MSFQIKTDFETAEAAIAYLNGEITKEIRRLEAAENELNTEKSKLIGKRDELLGEVKATKAKYKKFDGKEDIDIEELIAFKEAHDGDENEIQKKYQKAYNKDKAALEARLVAIEQERADEKKQAEEREKQRAAAEMKADAISMFSKPQHKILNPEQFYKLFGDAIQVDEETGKKFVELDYKKMAVDEYITHLSEQTENQHHFSPSGHSGSGGNRGIRTTAKDKKWADMNITERSMLFNTNPEKAKQLASEAGVSLPG